MTNFESPDLPRYPRFLSELVVAADSDGCLIAGTTTLILLRGQVAQHIVPRLLPLLDGTRDYGVIAETLADVAPNQLAATVAMLAQNGLVEEGGHGVVPETDETLRFFRRMRRATGANRTGHEAVKRLKSTDVVLVTARDQKGAADRLAEMLQQVGVGHATSCAREDIDALDPTCGQHYRRLFASLCFDGESDEWHEYLDDWCLRRGVPWLRLVVNECSHHADIGPLFGSSDRPCFKCFRSFHGASERDLGTLSASNIAIWSGMFATEIVYLLSRIGSPVCERGFRRYDLRTWASDELGYMRVRGCARCRPWSADDTEPTNAAVSDDLPMFYEDFLSLQRSVGLDPSRERDASRLGLALSRDLRDLSLCEQYALPDFHTETLEPDHSFWAGDTPMNGGLSLSALGALLKLTAGLRNGAEGVASTRWAPTAGNLGSVELFVAARNVDGLPRGCYFYQARDHTLALLESRSGYEALEEVIERASSEVIQPRADAFICFTAAYHRIARKYGPFGYRLVHMDAGVAISQLLLVAGTLGIASTNVEICRSDLIEQRLQLETFERQVTGVVSLRTGSPELFTRERGVIAEPAMPDRALVENYREMPLAKVCAVLHAASSVRPRSSRTRSSSGRTEGEVTPQDQQQLSCAESSALNVGELLLRRRTVRAFAEHVVLESQLSAVLRSAHDHVVWHCEERETSDGMFRFVALVQDIEGVSPGVYYYDRFRHALARLSRLPTIPAPEDLYGHEGFSRAPLQILITADLANECRRNGAWGHRHLLWRAGAAAHRLWFSALASGLAGATVAGINASAARTHLGMDGYRRAVLLAVPLGVDAALHARHE